MLVFIASIFILNISDRTKIASNTTVTINYSYQSTHFSRQANQQEKETIIRVLNNKKYHSSTFVGELSCGFSENISITIDNEIYEIACDSCPYINVKSTGKYLLLTDEEAKSIRDIFFQYGGVFPCE
ncbi:MAG: hypothetical protein IJJ41_08910 [Clostridia bacterium]|nr:hypothetical protein [Clostridia bacterium]